MQNIIIVGLIAVPLISFANPSGVTQKTESRIRESAVSTECLNSISAAVSVAKPESASQIAQLYPAFAAYTSASISFAAAKTADEKDITSHAVSDTWQDVTLIWEQVTPLIPEDSVQAQLANACFGPWE